MSIPIPSRVLLALASSLLVACNAEPPTPQTGADAAGDARADSRKKYLVVEPAASAPAAAGIAVPGRIELRPQASSRLASPVAGRVVSVRARLGDLVAAGDELVMLRSAEAATVRSALRQAQARASAADALLQRHEEMMASGVGTEVERAEARTAATQARLDLELARNASALAGTGQGDLVSLRAPAAGIVVAVRAAVGAMTDPGAEPLVVIADATQLWAVAEVAEAHAHAYGKGQRAQVRVSSLDRALEGSIVGFASRVDADTRRRAVYVALEGDLAGLTPGTYAELEFAGNGQGVVMLPATAVIIKDGRRRIAYVQRTDGSFEARVLRVGPTRDGKVTILAGLTAGEQVVVKGALLLDAEAEQQL